MLLCIIFLVLIVSQDLLISYMIALPVVVFSRPWTPHARVLKMPRLSNEYGILEVTCKLKWFWDLFITSVHSITRQLALWVLARGQIESRLVETGDFVNWIKKFFSKNFAQSPLLPCIHGRLAWLNSPVQWWILYIKTFYDVVIFIICCGREACVSIVLNTEWVQFVL